MACLSDSLHRIEARLQAHWRSGCSQACPSLRLLARDQDQDGLRRMDYNKAYLHVSQIWSLGGRPYAFYGLVSHIPRNGA